MQDNSIILLSELNKKIKLCRKCTLFRQAHFSVPGEGNPKAKIMFIGEAPGRKEDELGRPFVGRAGRLLTELLSSIKLKREDVFITSVIKHRPPKNRQPRPSEIRACSQYLKLQLDIIKPKFIVPLGRFGMEYFLPKEKISKIHGTMIKTGDVKTLRIFPVYHPAAGLRSTRNKNKLFMDFKKLQKIINKN
jgi:DNA polymerase